LYFFWLCDRINKGWKERRKRRKEEKRLDDMKERERNGMAWHGMALSRVKKVE
jgi:hypothetical protein